MRITRIVIPLFIVILFILTACVNPTPAQSPTPTQQAPTPIPTPKFTTPGTGAAIGQVMFPDNMPAHRSVVYIFKSGETQSFESCYIDTNGYYMFDNLPVGRYDIYTASFATFWGFTQPPDATITISERETTIVPTLTVLRHIEITLDNPKTAGIPGKLETSKYIIDGHNPKFTWANIQNAEYYVVTICSINAAYKDYDESQKVVNNINIIVWPTSLSSLPYQEFSIDVEAYMRDGVLIASGREWFAVDNPPEGWAFK